MAAVAHLVYTSRTTLPWGGGVKGIAPVGIYIINIKSYMYAAVSIFIVVITIVYEFNAIGVLDIRHFIV